MQRSRRIPGLSNNLLSIARNRLENQGVPLVDLTASNPTGVGLAYPDAAEPDGKKADVWFIDGPSPYGGPAATSGCHLAWRAQSRAQVDAFYKAAMAAGGKDNGAPGLRPDYHPHYYGAFVIDPEGNNIEAVCHLPE